MSLNADIAKLRQALKDLRTQWSAARESWRDAASEDFERSCIEPLEAKVRSAMSALSQMEEAAQRARRECE